MGEARNSEQGEPERTDTYPSGDSAGLEQEVSALGNQGRKVAPQTRRSLLKKTTRRGTILAGGIIGGGWGFGASGLFEKLIPPARIRRTARASLIHLNRARSSLFRRGYRKRDLDMYEMAVAEYGDDQEKIETAGECLKYSDPSVRRELSRATKQAHMLR